MTTNTDTEFQYVLREFVGDGSPFKLMCDDNDIISRITLKDRWKDIEDLKLEYTDPATKRNVKIKEEDLYRIKAYAPFKNHLQNETGTKTKYPVDVTKYTRADFDNYLSDDYDPDDPTKYVYALAKAAKKHHFSTTGGYYSKSHGWWQWW